jgi:hypothetical protein
MKVIVLSAMHFFEGIKQMSRPAAAADSADRLKL